MKRHILILLSAMVCLLADAQHLSKSSRKYNRKLRRTERLLLRQIEDIPGFRNENREENETTPEAYWVQQFLSTMDPALGRPTPEVLVPVLKALYGSGLNRRAAAGKTVTPWIERGPNNVGGRTRALAWDPWDASGKKVWAGGVGGGVWYNSDITSSASKWTPVMSLWSNLSVTAIAFGPIGKDTIYVGTGEGYGASSSMTRGFGIWKSTDGGKTFSQCANTNSFYYCTDIVVRNESGKSVVYASIVPNYYGGAWQGASSGQFGIFRSTNGGSTWTNVSGTATNGGKYCFGDLEIAADNRLWAGSMKNPNGGSDPGGGRIMYSDNGTTWTTAFTGRDKTGRVEVACAPSSALTLYAALESSGALDSIVVSTNRGSSFSPKAEPDDADNGISAKDFTRGQAWYDLILAVDPNDSNTCLIGGVDLFRSTNKAGSWTQISKWSNNANLNTLSCPYVHADQHAIAYKPGSSSTVVFGCDGGVFYTSSVSTASSSSTAINARNAGYNVTQFYWGDLAATAGSNVMIAGAQDNGTQRYTAAGVNSTTEVTGGDGAFCFISPSNSSKQVSSYVYNNYYYTLNSWSSSGTLISRGSFGRFINPAEWDDNGPGLFTYRSSGRLYRIKLTTGPGSLDSVQYKTAGTDLGSAIYAQGLSSGKTRLMVGTDAGGVYISQDAWATTPSFTSSSSGINAGNISGFNAIGTSDTLAVVLSNYGVNNIYTSFNGGTSWTARDGNLPNMPVWGIVMNPKNKGEAVIATDVGIYGTTNLFAASPTWTADTAGIGPVKVSTIRYRKSDQVLMAVTHGRGVFTNDAWSKASTVSKFGVSATDVCTNTAVSFSDSSLNTPTGWSWTVSPRNVVYLSGTDSSSQNPVIRFTKGGTYSISLTSSNALGNNTLTKTNLVTVTDTVVGSGTLSMSRSSLCAGDTILLTATESSALSGSITSWVWTKNLSNIGSGGATQIVNPVANDSFMVTFTSNKKCVSPATFNSNRVKPAVNPIVNASAKISASKGCANVPLTVTVNGTNTGASPSWSWYTDGVLQSGNTGSLTINAPISGTKVWATVNVSGPCVRPANLIFSDTALLNISPKPATPIVSRNFDTMKASNVGSGTYTWYKNGILVGTGRNWRTPANGTFKCVYSENGCSSDSSTAIVFNSLGVDNINQWMMLFPNPATTHISVPMQYACGTIHLMNSTGSEITSGYHIFSKPYRGVSAVNISDLTPGVYYMWVEPGQDCGRSEILRFRFIKAGE